jgi:hypothetical protein
MWFHPLSQAVQIVADGIAPSLIVVGPPGLGKSHEVVRTLSWLTAAKTADPLPKSFEFCGR